MKLEVVRIEWINDSEIHIYPPNETWWARPAPNLRGGDDLWELHNSADPDAAPSYHQDTDLLFEHFGWAYDMPVVIAKDQR